MTPLAGVHDPEHQREHNRGRDNKEAYVNPPGVFIEARAVVTAYWSESLTHESTIQELRKERAVIVQASAYRNSCSHLVVECRRDAALGGAYVGPGNNTASAFISLPNLRYRLSVIPHSHEFITRTNWKAQKQVCFGKFFDRKKRIEWNSIRNWKSNAKFCLGLMYTKHLSLHFTTC